MSGAAVTLRPDFGSQSVVGEPRCAQDISRDNLRPPHLPPPCSSVTTLILNLINSHLTAGKSKQKTANSLRSVCFGPLQTGIFQISRLKHFLAEQCPAV